MLPEVVNPVPAIVVSMSGNPAPSNDKAVWAVMAVVAVSATLECRAYGDA